jgi:hypothetical protein
MPLFIGTKMTSITRWTMISIDEAKYISDLRGMRETIDDDIGRAFNRGLKAAEDLMMLEADDYYTGNVEEK